MPPPAHGWGKGAANGEKREEKEAAEHLRMWVEGFIYMFACSEICTTEVLEGPRPPSEL